MFSPSVSPSHYSRHPPHSPLTYVYVPPEEDDRLDADELFVSRRPAIPENDDLASECSSYSTWSESSTSIKIPKGRKLLAEPLFWLAGTWFILSMVVAFSVGIVVGSDIVGTVVSGIQGRPAGLRNFIPLDRTSHLFQYNETFGDAPSEMTDLAWAELFPSQGGLFKNPELAPERSALSVFHQLHCLNGIRKGYWALREAATKGEQVDESSLPIESSPQHIRYYIDLLRNNLMCQPNTTIEAKDNAVGDVYGFGTVHTCWDWKQLLAWMARWETYEQETINATDEVWVDGVGQPDSWA